MSLIAIVDIEQPDLALTPTIRTYPDTTIEVVSHSATDSSTGMFFFLVHDVPADFTDALDVDRTVAEWSIVDDSASTCIFRIQHTDRTKLISSKTVELGGILLKAISNDAGWTVRLHLPDREAVSDLWQYCDREGISFELLRMFRQDEWSDGRANGVTDAQRVALETAYEEGYFEEPRDTSLEELAAILDISPTSVGGRIRRGTGRLVETVLLDK